MQLTLDTQDDAAKYALGHIIYLELENLRKRYGDRMLKVGVIVKEKEIILDPGLYIDGIKDIVKNKEEEEAISLLLSEGYNDEVVLTLLGEGTLAMSQEM
jgi:hypothetical protein